jgi:hypothetical protein
MLIAITSHITQLSPFRPILNILKNDDYYIRQSLSSSKNDAIQRMQMTKWMTMGGVALAVVSSSLFYVNALLYFIWFDYFNAHSWLNPFLVGGNVDSILNDLGVLMVSTLAAASTWSSANPISKKELEQSPQSISKHSSHFSDQMVAR